MNARQLLVAAVVVSCLGRSASAEPPANTLSDQEKAAGWLYQLYRADTDAAKPAGQWNQLRIIITPPKCEQYLNGVKYCEYVKGSPDWDERVAKSKFSKFGEFGKAKTGFICLQDHGNEVAFRNIKIREIRFTSPTSQPTK